MLVTWELPRMSSRVHAAHLCSVKARVWHLSISFYVAWHRVSHNFLASFAHTSSCLWLSRTTGLVMVKHAFGGKMLASPREIIEINGPVWSHRRSNSLVTTVLEIGTFRNCPWLSSVLMLLNNGLILNNRHWTCTLRHKIVWKLLSFRIVNIFSRRRESVQRLLACDLRLGTALDSSRLRFLTCLNFYNVRGSNIVTHIFFNWLNHSSLVSLFLNCSTRNSRDRLPSREWYRSYTGVSLIHRRKETRSCQNRVLNIFDDMWLNLLDVICPLLQPRLDKLSRLLDSITSSYHLTKLLDIDRRARRPIHHFDFIGVAVFWLRLVDFLDHDQIMLSVVVIVSGSFIHFCLRF